MNFTGAGYDVDFLLFCCPFKFPRGETLLKSVKLLLLVNQSCGRSVEDAAFVGRYHVLNVNERVFATVGFEHFESVLNQVTHVEALSLGVVDLVAQVGVTLLEQIHDGEDLSVVWHEGFADGVAAGHESLQNLQSDGDDLWVACVKGG